MAQVKKISVAKVYGKIDKKELLTVVDGKIVPKEGNTFVMRVGGIATGTKNGVSDNGPWTALTGAFKAWSAKDGEEHEAAICFLPMIAMTPLTVALSQASAQGVRFLIDLFVFHVEPEAGREHIGYEYTFVPVVKPTGTDPLAELLAQAAPLKIGEKEVGGTLALAAPAADTPATPDAGDAKPARGSKK